VTALGCEPATSFAKEGSNPRAAAAHVNKWAKERLEPSILLRDSYTGSPHRNITTKQGRRKRGIKDRTYPEERAEAEADLIASNVPDPVRKQLLDAADDYFRKIRNGIKDPEIQKTIFGDWK
jgi:hypothetical protein